MSNSVSRVTRIINLSHFANLANRVTQIYLKVVATSSTSAGEMFPYQRRAVYQQNNPCFVRKHTPGSLRLAAEPC